MSKHDESAMVKAHRDGRVAFHCNGSGVTIDHVREHAAKTYATAEEQSAFVAGYRGEQCRYEGK